MITRGYFLGDIIDGLGDIARQVETRTKLNLNDLPVFVEAFFKEVLNIIFNLKLHGLNQEQSNYPGLDLGDKVNRCAFQVTAQRSSQKVNDTLGKITDEALQQYPKIRILVVGSKQGQYSIDPAKETRTGFKVEDIIDINDLCKIAMDLPIDRLQTLFDHVRRETAKVKVELEIPNEDGKYPTTMFDYVEQSPSARMPDCSNFATFEAVSDCGISAADARKQLGDFANALSLLPRITREFFSIMIEKRNDDRKWLGSDRFQVNADLLKRIVHYGDTDGELRILQAYDFVSLDQPDHPGDSATWSLYFPGTANDLYLLLNEYIEAKSLSWRRLIVELDFSGF
jgi:hypothetical protein